MTDIASEMPKIIGAVFLVMLVTQLLSTLGDVTSKNICESYQNEITIKNVEIESLKNEIIELNSQLHECKTEYENLIEENITKKDFKEIENYFNITQIQINSLNQKFEYITENYFDIQRIIIYNYKLSVGLNIVLSLEILSFAFFKSELIIYIIGMFRKKRKE